MRATLCTPQIFILAASPCSKLRVPMERSVILLSSYMSERKKKRGKNTQLCGFCIRKASETKIKAFFHRIHPPKISF